ncbi:MAG: DUF3857 domain-containing protein [Bacteroidia bacterium]
MKYPIKNIQKFVLLFLGFIPLCASSQSDKLPPKLVSFEKDLRVEMIDLTRWGKDEKLYQLSDSEAKEPSVIVYEVIADYIEVPKISETQTQAFNYKMIYKRVHINEDKGVESYNKIYIPIKSEKDLVDLRAHTFSAKGKLSKEFDETDMKMVEEEGSNYLILALDGVEKGGEVEFYFIIRKNISEYGEIAVQGNTFKRNYQYVMRVPEHVDFLFKSYNGCPAIKEEKDIGDYNIYTLDVANISVLNKETLQNYDAELMRLEYLLAYTQNKGKVRLNTFADFSKNVFSNIQEVKEKSSSEIKKLSKKLKLADIESTEEKIRTIENWVKTNIVFSEMVSFTTMKDLIKNRYASELGLLRLYAFMFEENQIKYELWSTCARENKVFDESFESFNFLEDYYYYFPGIKKFIDLKNIAWRLGLPPSKMLGQKAIQIKVIDLGDDLITSKYTIGMAETPSCDATNEIMDIELKLDASMSKVNGKLHTEEEGYQNYIKGLYMVINDEEKRKEIVEEYLKRVSEDAKITKVEYKNVDANDMNEAKKPTIVDMEFTASKVIENAGDNIIVKIGQLIGKQSELYNEKPRQSKISNDYPHKYSRKITLYIPEGYTVKGLDKIMIAKKHSLNRGGVTDSIGFISYYTIDAQKLVIYCTEYYECLEWPKEQYPAYSEVINSAADFNKISVILEKKD